MATVNSVTLRWELIPKVISQGGDQGIQPSMNARPDECVKGSGDKVRVIKVRPRNPPELKRIVMRPVDPFGKTVSQSNEMGEGRALLEPSHPSSLRETNGLNGLKV